MRLTTTSITVSLLLFACAASALQLLHHSANAERRDGLRSSVTVRRRSLRPNHLARRRRRLGSRRISGSNSTVLGSDIDVVARSTATSMVPIGNPAVKSESEMSKHVCRPRHAVDEILREKAAHDTEFFHTESSHVTVYRLKRLRTLEGLPVVVKEVRFGLEDWTYPLLRLEISRLMIRSDLDDAFLDGDTCYIKMKDLGNPWVPSVEPDLNVARHRMGQEIQRDRHDFKLERGPLLIYLDFTWTRHGPDSPLILRSVGQWRTATFLGHSFIPSRHYCGILRWEKENGEYIPIFSLVDN